MLSANSTAFQQKLTAIGVCGRGTEDDPLRATIGVISEDQLQRLKVLCIRARVHLVAEYKEGSAHISPQRIDLQNVSAMPERTALY